MSAAEQLAPQFTVSAAAADALPYVLKTWGRYVENNMLEATPEHGFLHDFARIQAEIIRRSTVLCAMEAGRIVAFCVYEPGRPLGMRIAGDTAFPSLSQPSQYERSASILHWIATREKRRQQGAARKLLAVAGIDKTKTKITAWTPSLRHLGLATAPYTPFWLRS